MQVVALMVLQGRLRSASCISGSGFLKASAFGPRDGQGMKQHLRARPHLSRRLAGLSREMAEASGER